MDIARSIAELRRWRASVGDVAFVPTMGALHAGHMSLVEAARATDLATCVSIFVNPTQFAPHEDLAAYPRDEEGDLRFLREAGVDAAFLPAVEEMYPPGEGTRVRAGDIATRLEGAARPGHFEGVATVVLKLFHLVSPAVAFFGQKDFQQLRVIQTMRRDLHLACEVRGLPTVREPDGLAISSRDRYLSPDERRAATALSRGLFAARDAHARGERDAPTLRWIVEEELRRERAVELEYVSAADPLTLAELKGGAERVVISLAARIGKARLIDNVLLGMRVEDLSAEG